MERRWGAAMPGAGLLTASAPRCPFLSSDIMGRPGRLRSDVRLEFQNRRGEKIVASRAFWDGGSNPGAIARYLFSRHFYPNVTYN